MTEDKVYANVLGDLGLPESQVPGGKRAGLPQITILAAGRAAVSRVALLALGCPPFLYEWENRADIVAAGDELASVVYSMADSHPARAVMKQAVDEITAWLINHPEAPAQRASEPGPRSWNEQATPRLIAGYKSIREFL